ncbi:hypothetical protein [Paenibacillus tarimensis]|uniref:hypothetical protein n=1 Tax=Paenibacillus tarimensis TaxID=416012 RepID=UPI001F207EB6|nr:hypothetical protein [Paenibacillus tarimensis]MCF2941998.1 hypothetical protein [Paenibacillus tarimensis]
MKATRIMWWALGIIGLIALAAAGLELVQHLMYGRFGGAHGQASQWVQGHGGHHRYLQHGIGFFDITGTLLFLLKLTLLTAGILIWRMSTGLAKWAGCAFALIMLFALLPFTWAVITILAAGLVFKGRTGQIAGKGQMPVYPSSACTGIAPERGAFLDEWERKQKH